MEIVFAIGALLASFFISSMLMAKPQKPKPAAIGDFDFPQIKEGTPESVVFGDCWVEDWFVLWYGNFRTSAVKADQAAK